MIEISLCDIAEFTNGKRQNSTQGCIPVYGGNGIQSLCHASNAEDCCVIGRVGANCGAVYYVPGKFWASDNAIIAKAKNNTDKHFLYYLLKNLHLNNYSSGTSQPLITQSTLSKIPCKIPSLQKQHIIGATLYLLDKKIEKNNEINDNLAKQAMLIYQQILGTNSLSKCHLCDIATITMGQSPSGSSYNEEGIGMVFYQGRTDFGFRFPTRRLYTTEPKKMAAKNDILLSVRAPVGDINVANEPCCIGRGLSSLRSLHNTPSFLYYTMVSLGPQLDQFNGEGTVFGSVSQDSLNNLPIHIPPVDQIAFFEATVAPLDAMIMNNNEEIMRLTELRDYLLPHLLNGQISIGD